MKFQLERVVVDVEVAERRIATGENSWSRTITLSVIHTAGLVDDHVATSAGVIRV